MALNLDQQKAVEMALRTATNRRTISVLNGFAGTGKTFCLKEICSLLGDVVIITPTGRAALRVKESTGFEAQTIHSWLYHPVLDPETNEIIEFRRARPDEVYRPGSGLVIVDESSMINRKLWEDIRYMAHELNLSIMLVGDSAQLPPINPPDDLDFSVFSANFPATESVSLTEVYRQALDSPVLAAATAIRQATTWDMVKVELRKFKLLEGFDEVALQLKEHRDAKTDHFCICYTNAVRHKLNRRVRFLYNIQGDSNLEAGEPILIRRNNARIGVCNGEIVQFNGFNRTHSVAGNLFGDTYLKNLPCALSLKELITGTEPEYKYTKMLRKPYVSANLGYAMTCHSAQGSEADSTLICIEQPFLRWTNGDLEQRLRWTYTAFSRSKKDVIIASLSEKQIKE